MQTLGYRLFFPGSGVFACYSWTAVCIHLEEAPQSLKLFLPGLLPLSTQQLTSAGIFWGPDKVRTEHFCLLGLCFDRHQQCLASSWKYGAAVSRGFFIASSRWTEGLGRAWSDGMRGDGFKLTEVRSVGKAQVKYVVLGGTCNTELFKAASQMSWFG